MTDTQVEIARICDDVKELLLYKNKNYGDSALNPCRIFSQANEVEQLLVRIDDKLNRIKKGVGLLSTDEDVLMDVMYSGTKSDDFGITMAKIKSNAQDKGIDINETVDFYERSFEEISRPKKADGGLSNILGV